MPRRGLQQILIFLTVILLYTHVVFSNEVQILNLQSLYNNNTSSSSRENETDLFTFTEPEMMDSKTNRRVLVMQKKYISYETLKRDMTPCSNPGVSYYNCHAGVANRYDRGCEVITRCARDVMEVRT